MEQLSAPRGHVKAENLGKYLYDETMAALMGNLAAPEVTEEEETDLWDS